MGRERSESLRRLLALMRRFEGARYAGHLDDLSREFGVTTRTIRRDLALLESVGVRVPIWRMNERLVQGAA